MGRAAKTSAREQMEQNESSFSRHSIHNTFPLKLATSNFIYLLIQNFVYAYSNCIEWKLPFLVLVFILSLNY